MKILTINVNNGKYKSEENDSFGILDYSINEHLKNETYNVDALNEDNFLLISSGVFTGIGIPGAHRAIISGKSPMTNGFFYSTVGGLGEEIYRTSFNTIKIIGKANVPSVIIIRFKDNKLDVKVEEVEKLFDIYKTDGVFSLQEFLVKKYSDFLKGLRYRSIVAGPSGFNTVFGGLSSVSVKEDKLDYGSEGFAARGGYGSVLARAHNIAGVIFAGDYKKDKVKNVNKTITEVFNSNNIFKIAFDKTKKYREKGTFVSNYEGLRNETLMFNYNSILLNKNKREKLYDNLIKENYAKEFSDKKVISKNCGESCPAMCKKVQTKHVKDYEPYSSCGPNLGIFSQIHAERVVDKVDSMGFDAISFGNFLSLVFESLNKELIKLSDLNLDKMPKFNIDNFNINDSKINADVAIKLADLMSFNSDFILNNGIREFSNKFNLNKGVYFSFGEKGFMSPNQYLRPGFVAPLPIIGKFTTYYGEGFINPFELGKKSADRLVKEFYHEDNGFCRFHRGWSEELIPAIIKNIYGINYYSHMLEIIQKIIKYNSLSDSLPNFWEGKVKELIKAHIQVSLDKDSENVEAKKWMKKFNLDFDSALREYYDLVLEGIESVFGNDYKNLISEKINM